MRHHRVWLLAVVLSLSIGMLAAPASAWEFAMNGTFNWEYNYRSQQGTAGFFGPYDFSAAVAGSPISTAAGTYAPYNAWLGIQAGDLVSGSDAAWNTMYMINNIELRINPAIRVRGSYWIGEWNPADRAGIGATSLFGATDRGIGDLVASEYLNNRYPGIQRSFSPGYWNTLWLSAQLPWGEFVVGKRPSVFGMGLFYNGIENRTSESCALATTYGPLRIVLSFYPARRAAGAGFFNTDFDKNNGRLFDMGLPTVTYRNGPLDIGFAFNYGAASHRGGESSIAAPATRSATRFQQDALNYYGASYVKYNNGRFFFNAEFDFYSLTKRFRQGNAAGVPQIRTLAALQTLATSTAQTRDEYDEHVRWAVETGVLCGPTKVSALYAWLSGPDRRQGIYIDRQGWLSIPAFGAASNTADTYRAVANAFSNTGLFRPYSYLMVYSYGLGAHINADTQNGFAEDASIYAARVDYAVAANLNLYASFVWADRASQSGWGWGFIRPQLSAAQANANSAVVLNLNPNVAGLANLIPNIPDSNLGWEIDSGFDWKLLEGLLVSTTFAYWQPGKWWNYACIDKTQPNWNDRTAANLWGTRPDKSIDPIFALELKVVGEF
jgi:hypothetical protein